MKKTCELCKNFDDYNGECELSAKDVDSETQACERFELHFPTLLDAFIDARDNVINANFTLPTREEVVEAMRREWAIDEDEERLDKRTLRMALDKAVASFVSSVGHGEFDAAIWGAGDVIAILYHAINRMKEAAK